MKKTGVAVIGLGNIGSAAVQAIERAEDLKLVGVVRRSGGSGEPFKVVSDISELSGVDTALLCHPSRLVPELAEKLALKGINTVDSFDIHRQPVWEYVSAQDAVNKRTGTVSIVAAGWDPGTDSAIRALFEAMAPVGVTHTNFGPGLSMGHSVAARAVKGVKNALSVTIPEGGGIHSRKVYIELEDGYDFETVANAVKKDAYFAHDTTHVELARNIDSLADTGHGVLLERKGMSGAAEGQKFSFEMCIDNPALTSQIMVCCARAAAKLPPGCYTLPEIPPMALLPGSREELIKRLV